MYAVRAAASAGGSSRSSACSVELHEGRGELLTVTGAQTIDGYARLRGDARALDAAARACDAVGRLFETSEPHPGVFNLLCRQLGLLDELAGVDGLVGRASDERARGGAGVSAEAAAGGGPRPAAGRVRDLRRATSDLVGFSGAAGGVVCAACEAGSFPLQSRRTAS